MMDETKRNEIEKVCESLTREEAIELCKKLIAENDELTSENEELKRINGYYRWQADVLSERCVKLVEDAFSLEIKMHEAFVVGADLKWD